MRRESRAPAFGGTLTARGEVRGRSGAVRHRLALFGLLGLALLLLVPASPAGAALKYQPSGSFADSFNNLLNNSIAVNDHNGHTYVADSGTSKVDDFSSPTDISPAIWEGSNTPHGFFSGHISVAVDNSNGDVYVADGNHKAIVKFDENGNLITSFGDGTPGQLTGTATEAGSFSPNVDSYSSWGIAVDQANHDLYVLDGHNRVIDTFDQNGAYLGPITIPDEIIRQNGSYLTGLAVNSSGMVYVSDWSGPNQVYQFDSSGNYVRTLDGSNTPDGNFSGGCTGCSLISVATENSTGKVFVGAEAHDNFDVFDSSGNFLPPQGFPPQFSYLTDIAIDQENGNVDVAASGVISLFKPAIVPDVALGATSGSTATNITLNGHVDPAGGGAITDCYFQYVSNYSFEHPEPYYASPWANAKQAPCTANPAASLPYSGATDVSADVTGLAPGTGYHLRLTAVNANGDNNITSGFASVGRYQLTSNFGSAGSGDGQLNNPQDVAVDNSSGDIYVADTGNHRVVKLDSSGNFVSAWGWGVSDGSAEAQICTSGCQAGIAGSGAGQFATPTFIEVDNSAGPSAGDVYVADTTDSMVQKFDPEGNLLTSWETSGAKYISGGIGGIGVDRNGVLVVQPGGGNGIALDSNGNVIAGTLAIDTSNNDRYYSDGSQIQQYTTANGCNPSNPYIPCPSVDTFAVGNLHSAAGLTINPSNGVLYVANAGDNDIAVFAPLPLPTVTTATVQNAGSTSVTVTGHVDPGGGGNVVDCHFEYGTDTTYDLGSVPCSPGTPLSGPTDVSAELSGLTPFITYHYRLVAVGANDFGLPSYSSDRTFTPGPSLTPTIDATSFSDLTSTTVTLGAQINPNLAPTTYIFEYGTDTSYGSQTIAGESIGSDGVDHAVSNAVSGLRTATTYHFRVVAVNLSGVVDGPDRTFTTPASPAVAEATASGVTATTATLSVSIHPGYRPTTYHFEYGLTDHYGSSTTESPSVGSDNAVHPVSASISNLAPLTLYHFRVVATNAIGVTDGPDQTFSTLEGAPVVTLPPPTLTCKKGFVKRQGRCVRKPSHKRKRHRRSHQ